MTQLQVFRRSALEDELTMYQQSVLDLVERKFLARTYVNGSTWDPNACWLWTAQRMQRRIGGFQYGIFTMMPSIRVLAHRFSYEWAYGPFDKSLHVLHRCDNPPCVRPDHLFLGTPKDNILDAYRKGRRMSRKGVPRAHSFREAIR
jgi:hypothetical protein